MGARERGHPRLHGPNGCKLALIICHDGQFPEMARVRHKGAEIMIYRHTAPIRDSWRPHELHQRGVREPHGHRGGACGSDGDFDSMGEGMIVNFDGAKPAAHPPVALAAG